MTIVTDYGEEWVADVIRGAVSPGTLYIHAGTGSAPGETSTALNTPVSESRVAATLTKPQAGTMSAAATIVFTGSKTVTQVGLYRTSSGNDLIACGTLSQAVANGDSLQITINVNIT